jgi:two-component sensor histidine kinase
MPGTGVRAPSFRVAVVDITAVKHAYELSKYAAENENLLFELQHRVKNTLAQILAFIQIQADMAPIAEVKTSLTSLERRIEVLSTLYNMLYSSHDLKTVRLDVYIREVAWALVTGIGGEARGVELRLYLDELVVDTKEASSFGLITNELITNAFKYGFPDARAGGAIDLRLKNEGKTILLEISDDGAELPEDFSFEKSGGFGHTIIVNLAKQLEGEAFFERRPIKRIGVRVKNRALKK